MYYKYSLLSIFIAAAISFYLLHQLSQEKVKRKQLTRELSKFSGEINILKKDKLALQDLLSFKSTGENRRNLDTNNAYNDDNDVVDAAARTAGYKPFLILFIRGAGSTWLQSLLNSVPMHSSRHGIALDRKPFLILNEPPNPIVLDITNSVYKPDDGDNDYLFIGAKNKMFQMHKNASVLHHVSANYTGALLFLHRLDAFRHCLSICRKKMSPNENGVQYKAKELTAAGDIDEDLFRNVAEYVQAERERLAALSIDFTIAGRPVTHVSYEEMYADTEAALGKVIRGIVLPYNRQFPSVTAASYTPHMQTQSLPHSSQPFPVSPHTTLTSSALASGAPPAAAAAAAARLAAATLHSDGLRVPLKNTKDDLSQITNLVKLGRIALEEFSYLEPFIPDDIKATVWEEDAAAKNETLRHKEEKMEFYMQKHEDEKKWAIERFNRRCGMKKLKGGGMAWHCPPPDKRTYRERLHDAWVHKYNDSNARTIFHNIDWYQVPREVYVAGESAGWGIHEWTPIVKVFGAFNATMKGIDPKKAEVTKQQ